MSGKRETGGRPLRILALGMNYAPEPVGVAVYSTGLAEGLAAQGHDVEWIAATPWYPAWAPMDGTARGWSTRIERGVRVRRSPHPIPRRPTAPARLLQQAAWTCSAAPVALAAALARRPDVVLAVAPALAAAPLALAAARLAGAPAWLHLQDLEVDAAIGMHGLGARGAAAALAGERRLLRAFDAVTTISPAMRDRVIAKGVPPARVVELRNWADMARIGPPDRVSPLRRAWSLGDRPVALYSGVLGDKQGLDVLVAAARRLRGRPEARDLVILICGDGPARPRLEAAVAALESGGPEIRLLPLHPAEGLGDLLALADVHLLPQRRVAADLVLPSKLANMLASGRPVIVGAAPETQLAHEVAGCGLVVPPEDAEGFAEALATLLPAPGTRRDLGGAARARAEARWSPEAALDTAEATLRSLVSRAPLGGLAPPHLAAEARERAADVRMLDAAVRAAAAAERREAATPPLRRAGAA